MMQIWKNTKTLDGLIDDLQFTESEKEATVALLGSKPIRLDDFPRLQGIFRVGVSKDNVPVGEAANKGIRVGFPSDHTKEIIYEETASFTCFLVLKMMYAKLGTISPWVKYSRQALQNKLLAVIGTGNIGGKVTEKMRTFMQIKTFDVRENSHEELTALLAEADCLSLHISSRPENINFIDEEKLKLMKDGAVLVNTARGTIVDEDALYTELSRGRLTAAFDVYWKEPYTGKLTDFAPDRFFMTPHVASTCTPFLEGSAADFQEFIKGLAK